MWDDVDCKNTLANGNTDILTMKPGLKRNPGNTEQAGFRNIVVQNPRRAHGLSYVVTTQTQLLLLTGFLISNSIGIFHFVF